MAESPIDMPNPICVTPTTYEQDGISYTRITEVIHQTWPTPELQDWRASVGKARANRDLRHAQRIGSLTDAAITSILTGTNARMKVQSVEVRQALRGFSEWHALNPFKPVALQQPHLDTDRYLGGTPDCLSSNEGFDWKTSARFNFGQVLQIDQYWRLATQHGYPLQQYRLVRFDKILGIWEELVLTHAGVNWKGQWLTREFLGETFDTLLRLYRAWQYIEGHERIMPALSATTAP